ncbi:MAG: flagellar basal body-associated FliL family protein [Gemmatimonadetes bacterium]|jgi:flagellar basal body-associated protein FliL|nr:flagellar basal body-associated FliL family protein [Gemmatimonadota bacterium]MBT5055741.1 flagellar basal body-associated FliL family protein [Gemmatimonadota bacterium]MBT5142278.1 flagellar basal body-associated FliL family protein [Gemmatimonadota bacterium]MBT5589137.1 flagellar basal body-associated FliL family protein [Gemmatimonadota bacterium]MBT5963213.1 flagellar basal body-associated FliL family protein [Gemmatimonadota bacterium]
MIHRLMRRRILVSWLVAGTLLAIVTLGGCAPTPAFIEDDCPVYEDLGILRVNPAGALDRHLRLQAAFKVCPPEEGLAEITRKRIELKHHAISMLSAQTLEQMEHPLRAEHLREKLLLMVNEHVLKKSEVTDVFITELELE